VRSLASKFLPKLKVEKDRVIDFAYKLYRHKLTMRMIYEPGYLVGEFVRFNSNICRSVGIAFSSLNASEQLKIERVL